MANQLKMADIQSILALHGHGWSDRRIARVLNVHRGTVSRYVRDAVAWEPKPASAPTGVSAAAMAPEGCAASSDGVGGDQRTTSAPTGVVEQCRGSSGEGCGVSKSARAPAGNLAAAAGSLGGAVEAAGASILSSAPAGSAVEPPGAPTGKSVKNAGSTSAALPWRDVILQMLETGLSAQRVYQDLTNPDLGHGYGGSYYSVRRLIQKLCGGTPLPVRRMECAPGQEAQVDFGRGAPIVGANGKRKTSWVFRIVLSHSRKAYSEAVLHQSTDEFVRCLENAFAHFGGVPKTLVIDNLKAAVTQADWFDPELCPKMRSFAGHYGTVVLPTRPRTPRHKGKVENSVKYVKGNALKGLKFSSVMEENRHLAAWESGVADTRIHGTTRKQVIKLFDEAERAALLPLPAGRFELFHEALRIVHRDGHVMIKGAHYSAPPEYLGQELWVRWDGRTVRLFDQKMRPVAVHAQRAAGAFSTIDAHIHPHKINGLEKGATWLLGQTDRIGPRAKAWAEAMLASRGVEGVRVLMGLLSLPKKHSRPAIERACEVALSHEAWHLRSLRQLIEHQNTAPVQQSFAFTTEHRIIRPVADYGQFVRQALAQTSPAQNSPAPISIPLSIQQECVR